MMRKVRFWMWVVRWTGIILLLMSAHLMVNCMADGIGRAMDRAAAARQGYTH